MDKYSLADSLSVVLPYLSSLLASPQAVGRIQQAARLMPPVPRALLECRLSDTPGIVDLSQGISIYPHEKNLLNHYLPDTPSWNPIYQLFQHWSDPHHVLHQRIASLWIEFDLDKKGFDLLPIPGVFLRLPALPPAEVIELVHLVLLDLMPDRSLNTPAKILAPYLEAIPEGASATYIGVMFSRRQDGVRLNIRALNPDQVWGYLDSIGWNFPANPHQDFLEKALRLTRDFALTLDIHSEVDSRIGFECIGGSQFHVDAAWEAFLNYLIENKFFIV